MLIRWTAIVIPIVAPAVCVQAGQTGGSSPVAGDGVNPVISYYNYFDDDVTTDQIIHDLTNNTTGTVPLVDPDPYDWARTTL